MRCQPCKACKRPIHFVKTLSGKSMPCEVELVPFVVASGVAIEGAVQTFITDDGETKKGIRLETRAANAFYGYLVHWQKCPAAKTFRNAKNAK